MQEATRADAITVVLADDDDDIRQLVRINLEFDGRFEIVGECRDGVETVSAIRHLEPNIAVIDLDMPRSNGADVVRRIREARPDVTVVAYSASGQDDAATDAVKAGAHGYIDRPFDITRVAPKVAAFCANGRGKG